MPRVSVELIAPAGFFFAYLTVQVAYPAIALYNGSRAFAWQMYSGARERPAYTVTFEDGSTHRLPSPFAADAPIRVHSASVPQHRLVPEHLCRHWPAVREVLVEYPSLGRKELVLCQAPPR